MTQLIRLYLTADFTVVFESGGKYFRAPATFTIDGLFGSLNPGAFAASALGESIAINAPGAETLRAPIGTQEIWAAGVTYLRSKTARMEESKDVGGGTFYDRVYEAARPELFFKSTPHRTVGPGGKVRIRRDSKWNVPEPELTLAVNAHGNIFGFTIGNDMSSRDIEGENPLYLPQANAIERLGRHHFPGNVRELENLVKRMIILDDPRLERTPFLRTRDASKDVHPAGRESAGATGGTPPPLPSATPAMGAGVAPLKEVARAAARAAEREAIAQVLEQTGWNRVRAAKLLKISYRALLYKIKEVGLGPLSEPSR